MPTLVFIVDIETFVASAGCLFRVVVGPPGTSDQTMGYPIVVFDK